MGNDNLSKKTEAVPGRFRKLGLFIMYPRNRSPILRRIMNPFIDPAGTVITDNGRRLVRTTSSAWEAANDWFHSHPWKDNAIWLRYGSQRRTSDVDAFITKSIRWLQKTTAVCDEPGRIKGVRSALVSIFVVGLPEDEQSDPRLHAHAVLLFQHKVSTKAVQKRYSLGHSAVRLYDPTMNGLTYALDHHRLLVDAHSFQPRRSRSTISDADLDRLTLHNRLRIK